MSLLVLCPSLGRPRAAEEAYASFLTTKVLSDTTLMFVLNERDDVDAYAGVPHIVVPSREWMNEILQQGVELVLEDQDPEYLGFIGDDNRFRTWGWDEAIVKHLDAHGGGFAFGDDLIRHGELPCHVFVSASIVKALGYFGLAGLRHLYIDNAWRAMGSGAGCLYYLPDVVIEHLHPHFGRGEMDESYAKSNAPEMYAHDQQVFSAWVGNGGLARDVATIRSALE